MGLFGKFVDMVDKAISDENDPELQARLEARAAARAEAEAAKAEAKAEAEVAKAKARAEAAAAREEEKARERVMEEERNRRIGEFRGRQKFSNWVSCDDVARVIKIEGRYYLYEEIVSANLYRQGSTETTASLLSAALLNSMLAKRKTIGVCTSLTILVGLSNAKKGTHTITFISTPTKEDSKEYMKAVANAQQIVTKLEGIVASNAVAGVRVQTQTSPGPAASSSADEIRKFKELLDDGLITQEEFETKRKELLGL